MRFLNKGAVSGSKDYYKDTRRVLELCCHFTDLMCEHARNMLQRIQLQRVNRIGGVTVGMLTEKGEFALLVGLKMIGW